MSKGLDRLARINLIHSCSELQDPTQTRRPPCAQEALSCLLPLQVLTLVRWCISRVMRGVRGGLDRLTVNLIHSCSQNYKTRPKPVVFQLPKKL